MKPVTNLRLNTLTNCRKTLSRMLRWWNQLSDSEREDEREDHKMFLAYMKELLSYWKQEQQQDLERRLKALERTVEDRVSLRRVQ